jgi:hypothetical protein
MNLNDLAKQVHAANEKWWTCMETGKPIERNKGELLMLVITELSEAVEGIRRGDLQDDKLPHRKMEEVEMADAKIRLLDFAAGFESDDLFEVPEFSVGKITFDDGNKAEQILIICREVLNIFEESHYCEDLSWEISIVIDAIEGYCRKYGLDLDGAVTEKLAYNSKRVDHKHEARKLAGGKKF